MSGTAVGVDIGGTKIAAGIVSPDGSVSMHSRVGTPSGDPVRMADAVVELVQSLGAAWTEPATSTGAVRPAALPVGVGAAGIVDRDGRVRFSPNVPGWLDHPLQEQLSERLDAPVAVENDANAAAWGEFRVGAARGAGRSAALLTVGTGVGGGIVEDGRLIRGANGLAAELGHLIVAEGGVKCECGNRGCLESYASGTAIGRTARDRVRDGSLPPDSELIALEPDELTGVAVTRASQRGDEGAQAVLAECGSWLGVGLANVVNALDPEVVVVGGGGAQAGEPLLAPARAACEERLVGRDYRRVPPVVPAELGEDAGIIGAAMLLLDG
ncbi:ROK family protein [Egibacter rhizosphaerae]|uniref:ROK family protein n=1 Tax=Egibacter rhizosphaerae TaxID=1670831 RepID=A0A411YAD7_9ACTN|nr:ROK family protein [Egibacter rhizosphaerae]QBI18166.1 ROK family protein [Egibacter rhizosphaerae]